MKLSEFMERAKVLPQDLQVALFDDLIEKMDASLAAFESIAAKRKGSA
ncbi:MAG: hypothetical protein ACQCN3_02630 [Candidatus Bathyarchaeia archaeon]|jgi:hypothetical protein